MKLFLFAFLCALLAIMAHAVSPSKQIVVSYPENTPDSVLQAAKEAIIEAGGIITHEYSLIKGFAAKTTEKMIESVQALGVNHNVLIEEDHTVSVA